MNVADPVLERLEDQIASYDRKSAENQRRFKLLQGVQLGTAAAIRSSRRSQARRESSPALRKSHSDDRLFVAPN